MPKKTHLRIGTRGSALALVQAEATEAALAEAFPDLKVERVIIKTTGDRRTDVSLANVAKAEGVFDKGVFIKELELALADGSIDLAVHSLKDLPTVLESTFSLAATLPRAPIRDVLVTRSADGWDGLKQGAVVGTSSVRRARQVKFLRPDIETTDIRGNVPTRLRKLAEETDYDAILLAEAGLVRLGYLQGSVDIPPASSVLEDFPTLQATPLPEDGFLPAASQGAVGFETRSDDEETIEVARALNHQETWLRITAEREFLRLLDAGCHTPVGVHSHVDHGNITMKARVFPENEGEPTSGEASGTAPLDTAMKLFQSLS